METCSDQLIQTSSKGLLKCLFIFNVNALLKLPNYPSQCLLASM